MDKLDVLRVTFDAADRLIGDYYLVSVDGSNRIYDGFRSQLYDFSIVSTKIVADDICIVEMRYSKRIFGWTYILYSNGVRIFSEEYVTLLMNYHNLDVFATPNRANRLKCIVVDRNTHTKVFNGRVDGVCINGYNKLEIELSDRYEIITFDMYGNRESYSY